MHLQFFPLSARHLTIQQNTNQSFTIRLQTGTEDLPLLQSLRTGAENHPAANSVKTRDKAVEA